jgi:hypothetical protein
VKKKIPKQENVISWLVIFERVPFEVVANLYALYSRRLVFIDVILSKGFPRVMGSDN